MLETPWKLLVEIDFDFILFLENDGILEKPDPIWDSPKIGTGLSPEPNMKKMH